MGRLDGKIALISGGARGQGAAEAKLFAAEGATVRITDVLDDIGNETAESLGDAVSHRHHDVAAGDQWTRVMDELLQDFGRLDVLINNAGIFQMGNLATTTLDDWDRMIAINQTGTFLGMQAAARPMREQKSGSIINISSIAGLSGAAMAHSYGATKWAVRGMTKSAARELAEFQVRVNSIHPGIIETPMLEAFGNLREQIEQSIPFGRTAEASEVAQLAVFLASDESSYSSGHEFVIDGAMRA